jgi:hypothetical protein
LEQFEFTAISNGQETGAGRPVIGPVMVVVVFMDGGLMVLMVLERMDGRRIRSTMMM